MAHILSTELYVYVLQPNRHGNDEEIEDYVIESERLLALTVVAACTSDSGEIQDIVQNNWNTDLNITLGNEFHHKKTCLKIIHMSLVVRKPVFGVSDLVRHKPSCAVTEDG